jgi:hypothetical protein
MNTISNSRIWCLRDIQTSREVFQSDLCGVFFRLMKVHYFVPEARWEAGVVYEDLGSPGGAVS